MADFDITIAGEVNLDLILYGLDEAIPLNREILASNFEMTLGSSSAILAHNLAVLGRRVGFVTLCGSDPMGAIAMERLAESGADLSRCAKGAENTKTGVTILLSHGRSRRILTYPGIMFDMTVADLDVDYLASAQHFHLSSLFLQKGLHAGLPGLHGDRGRMLHCVQSQTSVFAVSAEGAACGAARVVCRAEKARADAVSRYERRSRRPLGWRAGAVTTVSGRPAAE